ncbi:YihY/virulence factor BrkB family protein [Flagellimonas sp. S174]|uniref:YihY/virulence factor BrkB family protein n=1 Tax=Flagellimonas sp. S174 TaxID=3410790 RepID=UPI003BF619F3
MKEAFRLWSSGEPTKFGATVGYYSILSLPALMVIILNLMGLFFDHTLAQQEIVGQIKSLFGADTAKSVANIISEAQLKRKNPLLTLIGVGTLIFGATQVFYNIQNAFNKVWGAKLEHVKAVKLEVLNRLKSFGFVLIIGFLLLVSMVLTSMLSVLRNYLLEYFSSTVLSIFYVIDFLSSIGLLTLLFSSMFKFLPNVSIPWKRIWPGGLLTACLFVIGKFLIGWYFGTAEPGSTYGAAGSVILIMLWVSYTSLILLFGANFTKAYSDLKRNSSQTSPL